LIENRCQEERDIHPPETQHSDSANGRDHKQGREKPQVYCGSAL